MKHTISKIISIPRYAWLTLQLFNKYGLANHAAAGAYGFLFSAAPALLIVSFFVSRVLGSSPETAVHLIEQMGFLSQALDMNGLIESFLSVAGLGLTGFISIAGLVWTARIFAVSLERGLGIIFHDTVAINPIKKFATPIVIEAAIIIFTFIAVFSSEAAFLMYRIMGFLPEKRMWFESLLIRYTPLIALSIFTFLCYMLVPARVPKKKSAFTGALFCICAFSALFTFSSFILNTEKYNATYGALGNLLVLLVNVYFFFILFFLGAELTFIVNSFDALFLSRFLQTKSNPKKASFIDRKLFLSIGGSLEKYIRFYKKGETLFNKGEKSFEIYYIISGEAEVYLEEGVLLTIIREDKFLGEMSHVLSQERSATIKAHSDLKVLRIPPGLFEEASKYSDSTDQRVITNLSERLRDINANLSHLDK